MSGLFRRLMDFDQTLIEITLNNMKEVDDVLTAVADFLGRMDCVKRISVANTKMSNSIGLVRVINLIQSNTLFLLFSFKHFLLFVHLEIRRSAENQQQSCLFEYGIELPVW